MQPTFFHAIRQRMNSKFSRFWALSWPERRQLIVAASLLPPFALALRVFGLARLRRWMYRSLRGCNRLDPIAVHRIAVAVSVAANNLPIASSCLDRALLTHWLSGRQGFASEVHLGVRLSDGVLQAHAWVECAGQVINDRSDIRREYVAFDAPLPFRSFLK
jgi:hypothetical protein